MDLRPGIFRWIRPGSGMERRGYRPVPVPPRRPEPVVARRTRTSAIRRSPILPSGAKFEAYQSDKCPDDKLPNGSPRYTPTVQGKTHLI
ncbi:hypothetical protein PIIN_11474 [Serendipita indica DSM 11827]|uniref:Uncharacterized protein n=1 Tax=Serendipita indica (strain DSM 11827) TaxID=1109443 RepID=G4U1Q4_SERID|nr:hypothetical protein PIIN_11474 [Serendipita indica DSM 11827]